MGKTNKQLENKIIKEAIHFLTHGKYSERKKHIIEMRDKGETQINGYGFQKETWCWVIWKPTDDSENPEFKGEPLCKVVPRFDDCDVEAVLNAQPWIYI